jgi:glutamate synthase (NADPH/NADH) small chain
VDYGQEEAAAVFGEDPRRYRVTVLRFISDEAGQVKAVRTVHVEWKKDAHGRMTPVNVPGTEQTLPADLVLLAMGFLGPEERLLDQFEVARDPRSNAKAEYGKFATSVEGVFAAGDIRRGQSLVVWAINEGRAAARECDAYLMGSSNLP